jgi:hypothetical protein
MADQCLLPVGIDRNAESAGSPLFPAGTFVSYHNHPGHASEWKLDSHGRHRYPLILELLVQPVVRLTGNPVLRITASARSLFEMVGRLGAPFSF